MAGMIAIENAVLIRATLDFAVGATPFSRPPGVEEEQRVGTRFSSRRSGVAN
jgi:hypothetical protein